METNEINFPAGKSELPGILTVPPQSKSLVIFSHGSGSSRYSVRNNYVAEILNHQKISTLLIDLLTEDEDSIYANRFDIDLLASRLIDVTKSAAAFHSIKNLPIGYFGASTGGASALKAAAKIPESIHAVVSRGGRPDLAHEALPKVKAPTLLIIGSRDEDVIRLNENAYEQMNCKKKIEIIEGASHLFEEKGALDKVAALAAGWFKQFLFTSQPELTVQKK